MSTFFSEMERIIKANGDRGLDHVLYYYGMELEIFRDKKIDVYSKVHSTNAGGQQAKVKDIKGVLVSDDFFPSTNAAGPNFQQGFLYCKETDIMVGDEIRVKGEDGALRAFRVVPKESIGQTQEVFVRYKIVNTIS